MGSLRRPLGQTDKQIDHVLFWIKSLRIESCCISMGNCGCTFVGKLGKIRVLRYLVPGNNFTHVTRKYFQK